MNSFNDWLILNPVVSSDDIVLWYALMNLNNISGWQKEFTVAISTIIDRTRLSRSAIYRSRNKLVQLGRIKTKERSGNQCSLYEIIPFSSVKPEFVSPNGTQYGTHNGTQSGTQSGTIIQTKGNEIKKNTTKVVFEPPDKNVVIMFFDTNGSSESDGEVFYDHYKSNGWMVGKAKMKDWHAAARNWIRRNSKNFKNGSNQQAVNGSNAKPGRSEINDSARANY